LFSFEVIRLGLPGLGCCGCLGARLRRCCWAWPAQLPRKAAAAALLQVHQGGRAGQAPPHHAHVLRWGWMAGLRMNRSCRPAHCREAGPRWPPTPAQQHVVQACLISNDTCACSGFLQLPPMPCLPAHAALVSQLDTRAWPRGASGRAATSEDE